MKQSTYEGTFLLLDRVTYTETVKANNKLFAFILLKLNNSSKLLKIKKVVWNQNSLSYLVLYSIPTKK